MDLGLKGKVALITGASKGIGLAAAIQLAKEGAHVAICARGEESLRQAVGQIRELTGIKALPVIADVTEEEDCKRAVVQTAEHFGRLDIVINNAGTSSAHPFDAVGTRSWQQDFDLKVFGAIHCSKYALPYMRTAGQGAIVNVTAAIAKTPSESSLPTTVSRAAGMALTKAMSKDLGKDNIRVNTVCIGLIRSNQIEKLWKKQAPDVSFETFSSDPSHQIPLGRIGEAEEAAKVIAFLVSEAASYVTGTAVNIDGGKAGVL
ncbi:MAG: SDR family NAD(P)-dependent oxidoreductase [Bacillus sp. (in: firmicutes)]